MSSKRPTTRRRLVWLYQHTIDGKPAYYEPGRQIVFSGSRWPRCPQPLVASLRQLRREQIASHTWRLTQGMESHFREYGYVRVSLPDSVTPIRRRREDSR